MTNDGAAGAAEAAAAAKETVGFIGLGIMGKPMATNLLRAGFPVTVHNRSQASVEALVQLGAARANSPAEVASASEIIITMVPDTPDVESVVLGPRGVKEGSRPGQLFIDMSTINPIASRQLARALAANGVTMLDAPVSGGEKGAIDGTLSIMVGGEAGGVGRAGPVFRAMGKTITHIGPIGAVGFTKLANQIIVAVNLMAISEALVFGRKAGIDPRRMVQALSGGLAGSKCLEMKSEKMLTGEFAPGFKIEIGRAHV